MEMGAHSAWPGQPASPSASRRGERPSLLGLSKVHCVTDTPDGDLGCFRRLAIWNSAAMNAVRQCLCGRAFSKLFGVHVRI